MYMSRQQKKRIRFERSFETIQLNLNLYIYIEREREREKERV